MRGFKIFLDLVILPAFHLNISPVFKIELLQKPIGGQNPSPGQLMPIDFLVNEYCS